MGESSSIHLVLSLRTRTLTLDRPPYNGFVDGLWLWIHGCIDRTSVGISLQSSRLRSPVFDWPYVDEMASQGHEKHLRGLVESAVVLQTLVSLEQLEFSPPFHGPRIVETVVCSASPGLQLQSPLRFLQPRSNFDEIARVQRDYNWSRRAGAPLGLQTNRTIVE